VVVVMATVRVGPVPNRLKPEPEPERSRQVPNRSRTAKPWTRRKKIAGTVEPPEKTARTGPKNRGPVHPVRTGSTRPTVPRNRLRTVNRTGRFQRPNGSLEPVSQSSRFLVKVAVTIYSINTHHFQTFQFTTHLFSYSLYLLSLLNYLITQLFS